MSGRGGFPLLPVLACLAAAFWLTRPSAAHGAEQRILCPVALQPDALQGKSPPPGWRLAMPQEARLTTAGMLHGTPEESGYLAPDESQGSKQGKRARWTQRWKFARPHWYETWAYCGYGGGSGPLQLFTRIAADAAECTLTSTTKDGAVDRMAFDCK